MNTYASTCISGLQEPVSELLVKQIPDVRIKEVLDGLIVYSTKTEAERIKKLGFINNTFLILKIFPNLKDDSLDAMIQAVLKMRNFEREIEEINKNKNHRFRIVTSKENKLVAVDNELLRNMEERISRVRGLSLERHKPDLEFWFLYRREKIGFFMMRLTKHTVYEKILNKGELRPELSEILCALSEPNSEDIFLDPYCGYGSIPLMRSSIAPYNMIFAAEKDVELAKGLKQKVKLVEKRLHGLFIVKQLDALKMTGFKDGFIHKIVTDPPWGLFQDVGMEIMQFYTQMIAELYRVLKPGGLMVILTAKKEELEKAILKYGDRLKIQKKYDILVSGKKAAIYKITKAE